MTRRSQLQAMVKRIKEDRDKLFNGCPWWEMDDIVRIYSDSPGETFSGIHGTVRNIDKRISDAEKEIAALPNMPSLESARQAYEYVGATNSTTKAYIAALEKCRPWVIRSKCGDSLWKYCGSDDTWHAAMFPSKAEAVAYAGSAVAGSNWEVVQWEGNE